MFPFLTLVTFKFRFPKEAVTKYMILGRLPLCSKDSRAVDNNLAVYIPDTVHGELKLNLSCRGFNTALLFMVKRKRIIKKFNLYTIHMGT